MFSCCRNEGRKPDSDRPDLHVTRTTGHHDVVMMSKEMKRAADAMMVNGLMVNVATLILAEASIMKVARLAVMKVVNADSMIALVISMVSVAPTMDNVAETVDLAVVDVTLTARAAATGLASGPQRRGKAVVPTTGAA